MPIRPFLKDAAFGPHAIAAMSAAFEDVCKAVAASGRSDVAKETIAAIVIQLAQADETDPNVLRVRALSELGLFEGRALLASACRPNVHRLAGYAGCRAGALDGPAQLDERQQPLAPPLHRGSDVANVVTTARRGAGGGSARCLFSSDIRRWRRYPGSCTAPAVSGGIRPGAR